MNAISFRWLRIAAAAAALAVPALAVPAAAGAQQFKQGAVTVDRPWTRATTVRTGAAYMTLKVAGSVSDRLVKVTSPDAEMVEIHTMAMDGGVARMREVKAIEVRPGALTQLKPGGFHLMMIGLTRPLREGESIKLTLTFETAGPIEIDATVEKAGAPGPSKRPH